MSEIDQPNHDVSDPVGKSPQGEPLRSVHTANLPAILEQLGISLLTTTYQAGRLVMLRSRGEVLNTHFRCFDKPMGLAIFQNRLAIGAATNIWEFHNLPAVCQRLDRLGTTDDKFTGTEPSGGKSIPGPDSNRPQHDACYLPRLTHWTGDIQIHEMAWLASGMPKAGGRASDELESAAEPELLFVNTRFSCLCRRSDAYNFEPVWRPRFVTQYVPSDCCHLNGLGVRDGRPRYVTALGESDEPSGWRERKRDGGIVIDIETDEIIGSGLSMPHSPRWYRDRLWLLESGTGSFGYLDQNTGRFESVCELAGFTRGLSFVGSLAFVGLSQVRESAVFGGISIAERALEERNCGVWVIDIETGKTLGFVRFEDAVQEIFAVEVLGARYPELVNDDPELLAGSFELPEETLREVPLQNRQL